MAGNQAIVQFLVEYAERGGNLPEKVKRDLDRLSQSSTQASSVTDKLGQAFTRLEKRDPMIAMRALKGAVDDLALSAVGATGPLGRLVANFATLGGGGASSLLVLGSIGAVLGGLKIATSQLLNPLLDATEGLEKFTAGLTKAKTAAEQLRDLQDQMAAAAPKVGLLYGLFGNAPGFLGGIGLGAGQALDRAGRALTGAGGAVKQQETDFVSRKAAQVSLPPGTGWQWAYEAAQQGYGAEVQQRMKALGDLFDAQRDARKKRPETDQERALARARSEFVTERLGIQAELRNAFFPESTGFFPGSIFAQAMHDLGTLERPTTGLEQALGAGGYTLAGIGRADFTTKPTIDQGQMAAIAASVLGVLGSARGGAGGLVTGLGGLASTLGTLKDKETGKLLLGGLGPLGTVLSFGGGLLSLFSSGNARVSISRLEEEAVNDMRRVMQVPQNVSVNVISGPRTTQQAKNDIARLGARDAVSTLPG